jgi:hypothetical protein
MLVCQEFTNQVALERERGMPVTAHMDGLTSITAIAKLQCGFIDYVVAPLWNTVANLFPEVQCAGSNLTRNRVLWKNIQEGLLTPDEAMRQDPPSMHSSVTNTPASELATEPTSAHPASPSAETQVNSPVPMIQPVASIGTKDITGIAETLAGVAEEAAAPAADTTVVAQSPAVVEQGNDGATLPVVSNVAVTDANALATLPVVSNVAVTDANALATLPIVSDVAVTDANALATLPIVSNVAVTDANAPATLPVGSDVGGAPLEAPAESAETTPS